MHGGWSRHFDAYSTSSAYIDPRNSEQFNRCLRVPDPGLLTRLHTEAWPLHRGPWRHLRGLAAQERAGGELRTERHVDRRAVHTEPDHTAWFRSLAVAAEQATDRQRHRGRNRIPSPSRRSSSADDRARRVSSCSGTKPSLLRTRSISSASPCGPKTARWAPGLRARRTLS